MSNEIKKTRCEKRGLIEYLATKAELPSDVLTGEFRIELRGRNTLFMQGCRRILKYSPEEMKIAAKGFEISIKGRRLVCSAYYGGNITVDGFIEGIELSGVEEMA